MNPELKHNEAQSRYELLMGERVAGHADYRKQGDVFVFTHTEIDQAFEGQGLGSKIAAFALGDVQKRGAKADPRCPFIAKYIDKHPEYAALVQRTA